MTDVSLPFGRATPSAGSPGRARPIVAAARGAESATVLHVAALIAERTGAAVNALSVVEPSPLYDYGPEAALIPPGLIEVQRARRRDELRGQVARARQDVAGTREWTMDVRYGEPSEIIAEEAHVADAQLVVMGIGRHAPIDRLLATETTLSTIRRARCPVLAVAPGARSLPRTVVAAVDFGPASIHAAACALALVAERATVLLVHVWSRSELPHPALQEAEEEYERLLPARFERLRSVLGTPAAVAIEPVTVHGRTVDSILEVATAHGADLIVAGTHGRGFVERLFVGSVATALLRAATCSVLVAPEPSLAERDRIERLMTGMSSSQSPAEWGSELAEFARRNHGRRTRLEVDDRRLGAQLQETGYALLGASYDAHDRRVELMLGDPADGATHLTRGIGDVRSVAVLSGGAQRDHALSIENDDGRTLLTFLGP